MNNLTNDLMTVLDENGIDKRIPRDMVAVAQGFLFQRGINSENTSIHTLTDPEEGVVCVDVNFYIPGTIADVMELDLQLTKTFVYYFPHIPYEFCITLTSENSV